MSNGVDNLARTVLADDTTSGGFRILVVDDNPGDRKLAIHNLERAWSFSHDMIVETAADGQEALDKIRKSKFTLMVLDWRLPTVDGPRVLRALRQTGSRIPVVVISGLQRADIPEDIESLGAAFLDKNLMTADTFREAITQSLRLLGWLVRPAAGAPAPAVRPLGQPPGAPAAPSP
jgi:CheY-like chemotaxis protein